MRPARCGHLASTSILRIGCRRDEHGSNGTRPSTAIAIGRIVVGASAYLAPNLTGRLFGLDPEGNPQASYLGRLFGARDVVLGAGVAAQPRRSRRTPGSTAGSGLRRRRRRRRRAGRRPRQLPPAAAAMVTATAAVFALAGAWLLQQ